MAAVPTSIPGASSSNSNLNNSQNVTAEDQTPTNQQAPPVQDRKKPRYTKDVRFLSIQFFCSFHSCFYLLYLFIFLSSLHLGYFNFSKFNLFKHWESLSRTWRCYRYSWKYIGWDKILEQQYKIIIYKIHIKCVFSTIL